MIATLSLDRPFMADHFHNLPDFIEEQHSHNWKAEITFIAFNKVDELNCSKIFDKWINQVQFTLLNHQESLAGRNPTAESLAQWLFGFLEDNGQQVIRVKIQEKENYWAAYGKKQKQRQLLL